MSWLCRPETLRKWMVEKVYGVSAAEKLPAFISVGSSAHAITELIQIDGSPHDWFEEQGPRCTLVIFIMTPPVHLWRSRFSFQKRPALT